MVVICIFISTIYAQNLQLGVSTKSISNSSTLGGDEWDFQSDVWILSSVMVPDLISAISGITTKLVNIKLELKASVSGTNNSVSKILNFKNTKVLNGVATVKFKFDFTEVSGLDKKLLFDVIAYIDEVQIGSIRRSVTRK